MLNIRRFASFDAQGGYSGLVDLEFGKRAECLCRQKLPALTRTAVKPAFVVCFFIDRRKTFRALRRYSLAWIYRPSVEYKSDKQTSILSA